MAAIELARTAFPAEAEAGRPPLVVAHGLFGSGRNWGTLARRFAAHRPVATVDLRNHGASAWTSEMDYPAMAADLLAAIDALGGRATLLGHSMGGKAAMAAALTRPEAVAGLLVADIAPVAYADHAHEHFIAAMRAVDLSRIARRSEVDPLLADAIPAAALRAFLLQNLVFEEAAGARRARWRLNLPVLAEAMPALVGWPEAYGPSGGLRYDGPSFFFHGGASDYVTDAARPAISALFPAARIEALEGAGHWLHAEAPQAFGTRVVSWLAETGL